MPRFGRGLPAALEDGLRRARIRVLLHLGDFTEPQVVAWFERVAPVEAVAGNNDGAALQRRFGRRKIVELAGYRIGLVHGDGRRGTTEQRALAAFADENVDVICFGHSHIPVCETRGGMWLLNPGSPTDKRRQPLFSYALLTLQRKRIDARLCFFDDKRPAPG